MRFSVVIPTFNEAGTITHTLERLLAVHEACEAIVVDDNSPDGTADRVRKLAHGNSRVRLIVRTQDRGFGTAVRDGFLDALGRGAAHIGQMDADGSHDPAAFTTMRSVLLRGEADVVIGSRYLLGSQIEGWKPWRYANSHVANGLARLLTGVPLQDATNGLRLFRREVLEQLDLSRLLSRGYSVILETNYRAHRAGFRICEIPITFHKREAGTSKMGMREIARFCWFLAKLRTSRWDKNANMGEKRAA